MSRAENKASGRHPTLHDKVYHFEHRLLPGWTYKSQGEFFTDLQKGQWERMKAAAKEIVGQDFADQLVVKTVSDSRVLIGFAKPKEMAECYFVLIVKEGESFRFFTLELTEDLFGDGSKTVVGGWSEDGGHSNFGSRKYDDQHHFLADQAVVGKAKSLPTGKGG